jgi:plasmid stabilization system protein ParE
VQHPDAGSVLEELRDEGWRKLIFRKWKIIYRHQGDVIVIGRVWPAAMGDADLDTPLDS